MHPVLERTVMEALSRLNRALEILLDKALCAEDTVPARLAETMRYAVFPGGARVRPLLCLAVASSCNEDMPEVTDMAAAAIELLHCASLVHDDLPCFDNAATRRGKPSVHLAFGEQFAVLAGDALIVLAFRALAEGAAAAPERLANLLLILCGAIGMPAGMVAGQARECADGGASWADCHTEKTGSLFAGAAMAGAAAAGCPPTPWRDLGHFLGLAYQIGDDICDVHGRAEQLGKPTGQDSARGRPNVVQALGLKGAIDTMDALVANAIKAIPACPGAPRLHHFVASWINHYFSRSPVLAHYRGARDIR
jgi:geranylgeranyl diphosphate synthase type II